MKRAPSIKKHKHDNAFYCGSKQCRKSAWATPEYMESSDWEAVARVIEILKSNNVEEFSLFVRSASGTPFFDRVIGWPEGYRYCYENYEYVRSTAMPTLVKHDLPKLCESLLLHTNTPR